jgi:hypothetical protein
MVKKAETNIGFFSLNGEISSILVLAGFFGANLPN